MRNLFTIVLFTLSLTLTAQSWFIETDTDLMTDVTSTFYTTEAIGSSGTSYGTPWLAIIATDGQEPFIIVNFGGSFVHRDARTIAFRLGDGEVSSIAITSNDANAFINETWSGVLIEQFPHFDYVTFQVRTLRGTAVVQFSLVGFADLYPTN